MCMVELLTQLFKLWENSHSLNLDNDCREKLIDDWSKLCWRIQIQMLLEPAEKAAYINAIAALSEQIYIVYRKNADADYLRKILSDLESLLEDRDQSTMFKVSHFKSVIAAEGRNIIFSMKYREINIDLINILQFAFNDINRNYPISKRTTDYLQAFSFWISRQRLLTADQLIEHLILINFNHPQLVEYIVKFYEIAEYPTTLEQLYAMQKSLMEKQRHFEYLNLLSSETLFSGSSTIINYLLDLVRVDLEFVRKQMKRHLVEGKMRDSLQLPPSSIINKKRLTKWPSDKSDLIELAYAMYIYMRKRGALITITMLVKWFEDAFGVNLSRYSHRFAEIKMRKSTRPSKFLDTMVNEFLDYIENSDAFQTDS
ncbi:hypothetical protein DIU31_031450 [Mucilaginibacter rubeus]|uniref:Uncharacterized protein n=2 Tax=Mucilaginibacter rubeus TaxID=2027860 RepID=A0AAE6JKX5_9SPHI|nr:hypothetical protein DIU31_031450 [Mucilaginibacter rubeus]QEM20249.1 hypothetical protein DIU38_031055 [Mucilaginibacter gossypii]